MRMKISTKGRYALRLMVDLALNSTGEPVSLKDIAKRQGISDKYLEGSLAPVSCVEEGDLQCERQKDCATIILWKKISDAVSSVVDHVTLQDLVDWQIRKGG